MVRLDQLVPVDPVLQGLQQVRYLQVLPVCPVVLEDPEVLMDQMVLRRLPVQ